MAWQIPQSQTSEFVFVDLKTEDSAFVASGVTIATTQTDTIKGTGSNHQVLVYGTVATWIFCCVYLGDDPNLDSGNKVTVKQGGHLQALGGSPAVAISGYQSTILNEGLISNIHSGAITVWGINPSTTSTITNRGTIEAQTHAILVASPSTEALNVMNSGTITGGTSSFLDEATVARNDFITNTGMMIGDISLGGGEDFYDGRVGTVVGTVLGGNGNDRIYTGTGNDRLNGGPGFDTLQGGSGNDTYYIDNALDKVIEGTGQGTADWVATSVTYGLGTGVQVEKLSTTSSGGTTAINISGNEFAQTITGNAGTNLLTGKGGNDTLTGGGGADMFFFDTALNATTNIDRITDFNVAADTIRLENGIFIQIAGTGVLTAAQFVKNTTGLAQDANDRIIYETDTGKLSYDSNGSTAGGAIQFATLAANLAVTNADFFVV